MGSGTGPKVEDIYLMRSLPDRTSPALPKTIIDSEKLKDNLITPQEHDLSGKNIAAERDNSSNEGNTQPLQAKSWSLLIEKMTSALQMNLDAQELMILLDSSFEQILSICDDMNIQYSVSNCTIEPELVTAVYTPKIINLIVNRHYTSYVSAFENLIPLETIINRYKQLEGKTVVFEEIIYNPQKLGAYNHYLSASTNDDDSDKFIFKWTNDKTVVEITIAGEQHSSILKYQANEPAEKLVVTERKSIDDFDVIFNASITSTDPLTNDVLIDAQFITPEHGLFSLSQISDTGGFSFNQYAEPGNVTDPTTETIRLNQEYFETNGMLLAFGECSTTTTDNQCQTPESFVSKPELTGLLTDSPEYFELMEFSTLLNTAGFSNWNVANMPTDIKDFLVVTNESLNSGTYLDILCFGSQSIPGEPQLHCAAPESAFQNIAIVLIDEDNNPNIIEGAVLVPAN